MAGAAGAARQAGVGGVGAEAVAVAVEHRRRVVGGCWGSGGWWDNGGSCTRSDESLLDRGCVDGCSMESVAMEPCVAGGEQSEAFAVGGVEVGDEVGVGLLSGRFVVPLVDSQGELTGSLEREKGRSDGGAIADGVFTSNGEGAAFVDVGPNRVDGVGGCPGTLKTEGVRLEFFIGDGSEASDELVHDGEDADVGVFSDGIGKGADEVVGDGLKDLSLKRVRSFDVLGVFRAECEVGTVDLGDLRTGGVLGVDGMEPGVGWDDKGNAARLEFVDVGVDDEGEMAEEAVAAVGCNRQGVGAERAEEAVQALAVHEFWAVKRRQSWVREVEGNLSSHGDNNSVVKKMSKMMSK